MRAAPVLEDYLAEPLGRYHGGRHVLHWYADPALTGLILWGRPDDEDVRWAARVLDMEIARAVPYASLLNARRVEGVDAAALAALVGVLGPRADAMRSLVTRQAVVIPAGGIVGVAAAGFWTVFEAPFPTRVFTGVAGALRWLGREDRALLEELERLETEAMATDPVVRALRDLLAVGAARMTLWDATRALRLSRRSLQRRLRQAGTTFQAELLDARMRAAQALLLDTDTKLTAVAVEAGWSSLQHFSAAFRRFTGESPSAWRARRRG